MVNSEKFSVRLQKILEYYDLSAAAFADAIDVGRSSISHILSGRNKPSLDFVLKVVQTYPEVELYWLLNGKGSFPLGSEKEKFTGKNSVSPVVPVAEKIEKFQEKNDPTDNLQKPDKQKEIKKIVIFYSDGTFDAFEN